MMAGGPQYQPSRARWCWSSGDSESNAPPKYLLQGSREELLERVKGLRDNLKQMAAEELKRNEIDEDDRQVQIALYEKLSGQLGATYRKMMATGALGKTGQTKQHGHSFEKSNAAPAGTRINRDDSGHARSWHRPAAR